MEPESRSSTGLTAWLAANRNQGGLILMIAGIVLAVLPVWLASQYGTDFLGIEIITGLVAALLLFAGVGLRFRPEGAGSPMDEARLTVLGLGGLIGLCVAVLGILLNIQWWDFLTRWLRFGERDGAWKVLLALVTLVVGLGIMFISLASVRSEERSSPVLRRLIYGYNAVLSGILLLLILIVINTLAFVKLPAMVDSTESGMFKINDRSKQILRGLDKPTSVYLLMSTTSDVYDEMRTLLGSAQEYAPKLRVETFSTGISAAQIRELQKEHPEITSDGVLVVYGDEKGAPSSFIKTDEIMKDNFGPRGERTTAFEGESRLMTELAFLSENKQKPIVYFANGNAGEYDINDSDPTKATGIGTLKSRLEKRNFEVRALKFDLADPKVPDDAQVVVIPNPHVPYSPQIAGAFAKYLNERKGKLIALFDVPIDQKLTAMPVTGLESLLATFQVDLSKDRVLTVPGDNGEIVIEDPESTLAVFSRAKNPIATAFRGYRFLAEHPRVVRPVPPNPSGPASFRAETLVETRQGILAWAEPDVATSPRQLIEAMRQDRALARKKLTGEQMSLAVTVTETSGSPMGGGGGETKPRMAVFGFASFITNPRLDETRGVAAFFDFFAGTLDWLREKATNIGIEPRQYKNYMLEQSTSAFRLVFLPGILALVCIVGLGAGVWVVRRR